MQNMIKKSDGTEVENHAHLSGLLLKGFSKPNMQIMHEDFDYYST